MANQNPCSEKDRRTGRIPEACAVATELGPVVVLRSFTDGDLGGNRAGVLLLPADNPFPPDDQMLRVSAQVGLSETAFVRRTGEAEFDIRFFTPNTEIDLCGHATIGVFGCLNMSGAIGPGEYTQRTSAGLLRVRVSESGLVRMMQNPLTAESAGRSLVSGILESLGSAPDALDERIPVIIGSTGVHDLMIALRDESLVRGLNPDFRRIARLSEDAGVCGYHVFAVSGRGAVCRNFAPLYGIPEESATGTANGVLGSYLVRLGIWSPNENYTVRQGMWMDQPSQIHVTTESNGIVWVGGSVRL